MKKIFALFLLLSVVWPQALLADHVDVCWPMGEQDNLAAYTMTAGAEANVTPSFVLGNNLTVTGVKLAPDAESGYTAVEYNPVMVLLTPKTRVTQKTSGHQVSFRVKANTGHTFKPTTIELDAAKCGTDGGNFDVYIRNGAGEEVALATAVSPLRNKVGANNSTGDFGQDLPADSLCL